MAMRSFGVDLVFILGPARGGARVTFARHQAMYLAVVEAGLSYTEVGLLFTRDRRAVAYGVARLEERRDVEPGFDAVMDTLGAEFRQGLDHVSDQHGLRGLVGGDAR